MPGFDGTGPLGLGSMTGRGMGYCVMVSEDTGTGKTSYGYAGLTGIPVRNPFRTSFTISNIFAPYPTYSWRINPYSPFLRPGFGMRFGRRFRGGYDGFAMLAHRQGFGRGRWF